MQRSKIRYPVTRNYEQEFAVLELIDRNNFNHEPTYGIGTRRSFTNQHSDEAAPSAPMHLLKDVSKSGSINLSWNPPNGDGGCPITKYLIYYCDGVDKMMKKIAEVGNEFVFDVPKSLARSSFIYGVQAENCVGTSIISVTQSNRHSPSTPQNLCVQMNKNGDEILRWCPPINEIYSQTSDYIVHRFSHSFQQMVPEKIISGEKTSCLLSEYFIHHNSQNKFGVLARNSFGCSKLATIILQSPSAPMHLLKDVSTSGSINLSWNPPNDDGGCPITKYLIFYCDGVDKMMKKISEVGNEFVFDVPKSLARSSFIYGVQAQNCVGTSSITVTQRKLYLQSTTKKASTAAVGALKNEGFYKKTNLQSATKNVEERKRNWTRITSTAAFSTLRNESSFRKPTSDSQKNKSSLTEKGKTETDIKSSCPPPVSNEEASTESTQTFVSTYNHEFQKSCDINGCKTSNAGDLQVLTLPCCHKICYNCYGKAGNFLHWNSVYNTYELKCMVCGSSTSVYVDRDGDKIIYLKCVETEEEKSDRQENRSTFQEKSKKDVEIESTICASQVSEEETSTENREMNDSIYNNELDNLCDMNGCQTSNAGDLQVLTLPCCHKICYNCYGKADYFLHWSSVYRTFELKCMVCGSYTSVDVVRDGDKIIYLKCTETEEEKNIRTDITTSRMKAIPNIGSACYANCILQVLGQTPNLVENLTHFVDEFENTEKIPISSLLLKILDSFQCDNRVYLDERFIKHLIDKIHAIDKSFERFRQNDCHSFLMCLLNGIKDEVVEAGRELKSSKWKNFPVMFEGKMCNYFEYLPCKHKESSENQIFTSLLIPIPLDRPRAQWSVEEGLNLITESEQFDGEKLPCTSCDGTFQRHSCKSITTKTLVISVPPEILIFQLGRFREDRGYLRKVNCKVSYGEYININVKNAKRVCLKYELYGVVLHYGSLESGHYYSYVKSQTSGQWFYCSDRYIRKIDDPYDMGFSEAYLLFYRRINN